MGMFGIGEILTTASSQREVVTPKLGSVMTDRQEMSRASVTPMVRGTGIGFALGLIPGMGAVVPTVRRLRRGEVDGARRRSHSARA